ncbi:MAG TPA: hypothetical protein VN699_05465 [Pirellulales bacterium]|nr:hypothetical protein [Pirellulales bacterium]
MSIFHCVCGVVNDDEAPDASCVAYPLPAFIAAESRVVASVAAFFAADSGVARAGWLAAHFGMDYPTDECDRVVVEDIVSREFNDGFIAMFRCLSCGRVWLCDPITNEGHRFAPSEARPTPS